jgi:hypothetical protein
MYPQGYDPQGYDPQGLRPVRRALPTGPADESERCNDGSKFKAVNNRDKNFTRAKMERRLAQIDQSVCVEYVPPTPLGH